MHGLDQGCMRLSDNQIRSPPPPLSAPLPPLSSSHVWGLRSPACILAKSKFVSCAKGAEENLGPKTFFGAFSADHGRRGVRTPPQPPTPTPGCCLVDSHHCVPIRNQALGKFFLLYGPQLIVDASWVLGIHPPLGAHWRGSSRFQVIMGWLKNNHFSSYRPLCLVSRCWVTTGVHVNPWGSTLVLRGNMYTAHVWRGYLAL